MVAVRVVGLLLVTLQVAVADTLKNMGFENDSLAPAASEMFLVVLRLKSSIGISSSKETS